LLLLPVLVARSTAPPALVWGLQLGVLVFGVLPVALFLAAGRRAAGVSAARLVWEVPAALLLGIGLSLNNTRAVLEGLTARVGEWERTPKTGEAPPRGGKGRDRSSLDAARGARYRAASSGSGRIELG